MRKARELTNKERMEVIILIQKGYAISWIKQELDVPTPALKRYFAKWNPQNYKVIPVIFSQKKIPYYDTENEYAELPSYKWEDLSQSEIDLYLKKNYALFLKESSLE